MKYPKRNYPFQSMAMLLCLFAAGCSVGPNYHRPETAAPPVWQEAQQSGIDTQAGQLAEWWKEFKDPVLDGLVARAVKNNLDLRIAEARVREERATLAATAAGLWPTLDLSGSYSRNRASQNAVGSPTQGAVVAPTGGRQLEQNFYKTGFDSSWEIDIFGGTRRQIEGAEAILQASIEERRGVVVTLLGDVARNYIDSRGLQRRLEVALENLRAQQDTLGLTKVRFDAGIASDFEVAQSEGQVNTTAAQIPALQSALKQAAYRVDVLLGTQPGTSWDELAKVAPIPALPPQAQG